mgnify:FL=1|jgi:hypothetical protein
MRVEWGIAAAFGPLLCFEALMGPKTITSKPRSLEVTEEKRRKSVSGRGERGQPPSSLSDLIHPQP